MTYRIDDDKWILYRHTRDFELIKAVALDLKNNAKSIISKDERKLLMERLKILNLYKERNPSKPLDAINHRINTLAYFLFGYKQRVNGEKKFLFSPLGNLFLKYIEDKDSIIRIFFTMLWGIQFEHPHGGTINSFQLYPFRLIFKLINDERLEKKLYAFEMEALVVFVKEIDDDIYEDLVDEILSLRSKSNDEITELFNSHRHVLVNAAFEWDYYLSKLFEDVGVINRHEGEVICKLRHGDSEKHKTYRKITRNYVEMNSLLEDLYNNLQMNYPFDEIPLKLNDPERLRIDVVKEIYSFYPKELLDAIGEEDDFKVELLELSKLIERYSNNNNGEEAYLFEEVLTDGFNLFINVDAQGIGGAGKTDLECLYTENNDKFAVDAKSTKNKLSGLNAGRLRYHRELIGGQYTIVVTPRYVPAVKRDIRGENIVIILASTFSEYLYNCINYNYREIDYTEIHELIKSNLGKDISPLLSELTIRKFSVLEQIQ